MVLPCRRVKDTYDSTKAKLREAAESVEPHNDVEAIKSEGGIPCNTADLVSPAANSFSTICCAVGWACSPCGQEAVQ